MTKEQYMNKRKSLLDQAKGFIDEGDLDQFNVMKTQIEELDSSYEKEATAQANFAALQGSGVVPVEMQNMNGAPTEGMANAAVKDPFDSDEYNQAFMNFACRGTAIPAKFQNAAQTTTTTEAGAVIPKTIVKEIIRNLKERGVIFQQLRHMNLQGGVEIPILDLSPTANWITEAKASDDQKVQANTKVSFNYYGLECKIAQSILVSVATFEEFQALFVELATEAVIAAIEKGVFTGTGSGQMLGVCADTRVTNKVELKAAEVVDYSAWKKKVFAKIPKKYQRGKFYMAQGTFEGYIDGMVDKNGQPVGRTNYGISEGTQYRFGGKDVETVEDDVLAPYDAAEAGAVFAVYMNMKDYVFNSNMTMTVVNWIDHDTNKKKMKVMLICDGKAADTNGIILIKKANEGV